MARSARTDPVASFLAGLEKADLVRRLLAAAAEQPDLRSALEDEAAAGSGESSKLLRAAEAEMERATEPADWGEPAVGYGRFEKQVERLVKAGEADGLVEMLPRFVARAILKMEHGGGDDWEVQDAVAAFVPAVRRCTRPDPQKLLLVAGVLLADDYGYAVALEEVWEGRWSRETWRDTADLLLAEAARAERPGPGADFSPRHHWGRRVLRIVEALDRAEDAEEATGFLIAEAAAGNLVPEAVERLMAHEQPERATTLALEGIQDTPALHRGVVHRLQELLAGIAEKAGDSDSAAAVAADRFFARPSVELHQKLMILADAAGCRVPVAAAAQHFLETGEPPEPPGTDHWPLPPVPGTNPPAAATDRMNGFAVLIGLGIAANDPAAVRRWHLARVEERANRRHAFGNNLRVDQDVAEFLAPTDPVLAAGIHFHLAHAAANGNGTRGYPTAAAHIRAATRLLAAPEHEAELRRHTTAFHAAHGAKWRLMEQVTGKKRVVKRKR